MGEKIKKFIIPVFVFCSMFIQGNSTASVPQAKEEFRARLLESGPGTIRALKIKISIKRYTSYQEIYKLIQIYHERGYKQFRRALRGMNKGNILPAGGRGLKLVLLAAQKTKTDGGRRILVVAEGHNWIRMDPLLRYDSRFPFLFIDLIFDARGKGTGRVYPHADIRLTNQGIMEIASFFSPPIPLFDVSALE